jgi:hypothetical protein
MKGILFTEANTRTTIAEMKTQTRRIIVSRTGFFNVESKNGTVTNIWQCDANGWNGENLIPVKPRYKVGETVYIKEPYYTLHPDGRIRYKYEKDEHWAWKNKLFMPAKYARRFIEVTGIRAEHLQDISNSDCLEEGIFQHISHAKVYWKFPGSGCVYFDTPREAYADEIDFLHGQGTWESNPFVWVYDYKLKEK